ncbi:MAG: ATP-dependent zinc protease [Gammaproteobacteria bacterium]
MLIGWQEWCALPQLHLPAIKAKIDTGAKTSVLHADDIKPFYRSGVLYVHFNVHPLQKNTQLNRLCTAKVVDQRIIMSSNGHKERRYVIHTPVMLGPIAWEIDITLTHRGPLSFRMLLGRDALKGHSLIDPSKTLLVTKLNSKQIKLLYQQY